MTDNIRKEKTSIERIAYTDDYHDFKGLNFKFVEYECGNFVVETTEPTYIKAIACMLDLKVHAPTVLEFSAGKLILDSYAPLVVSARGCAVNAHLRENTYFRTGGLELDIVAADDLALMAKSANNFNGTGSHWDPIVITPPLPARGSIFCKDGVNILKFRYESGAQLYLSEKETNRICAQNTKELNS